MTRTAVVLSVFLAAACDVGSVPINSQGGVDASMGGNKDSASGDGASATCATAVNPAPDVHLHAVGGTSNQGQNCLASGCHAANSAQPFTWAGTVFAATTGAAPNPGAQIRVVAGGVTFQATTDKDGNFYSTQAVAFPGAHTNASKCPTTTPMSTILQTGNGACNSCHSRAVGATTTQINLQ
jgi:hypothetical protein